MIQDDFDLDQTNPGDEDLLHAIAALSSTELSAAIETLPHDLQPLAIGVHVHGRTLSDVSQELGLRQAEVVRGLRRARRAMLAAHGSTS